MVSGSPTIVLQIQIKKKNHLYQFTEAALRILHSNVYIMHFYRVVRRFRQTTIYNRIIRETGSIWQTGTIMGTLVFRIRNIDIQEPMSLKNCARLLIIRVAAVRSYLITESPNEIIIFSVASVICPSKSYSIFRFYLLKCCRTWDRTCQNRTKQVKQYYFSTFALWH